MRSKAEVARYLIPIVQLPLEVKDHLFSKVYDSTASIHLLCKALKEEKRLAFLSLHLRLRQIWEEQRQLKVLSQHATSWTVGRRWHNLKIAKRKAFEQASMNAKKTRLRIESQASVIERANTNDGFTYRHSVNRMGAVINALGRLSEAISPAKWREIERELKATYGERSQASLERELLDQTALCRSLSNCFHALIVDLLMVRLWFRFHRLSRALTFWVGSCEFKTRSKGYVMLEQIKALEKANLMARHSISDRFERDWPRRCGKRGWPLT